MALIPIKQKCAFQLLGSNIEGQMILCFIFLNTLCIQSMFAAIKSKHSQCRKGNLVPMLVLISRMSGLLPTLSVLCTSQTSDREADAQSFVLSVPSLVFTANFLPVMTLLVNDISIISKYNKSCRLLGPSFSCLKTIIG